MTSSHDIRALREEAQRLADSVLGNHERSLLDTEQVERREAATARVEAAAGAPITIGFVGQFSSGKSVLLGAMLGDSNLLPATSNATTGNVTALRPIVADDGGPTRVVDPVSVRYFDESTVIACREAMVRELVTEATGYGLSAPADTTWEALTEWCQRVAWGQPNLRVPTREFMALRDAALSYPWLIAGAPLELDWDTVRQGLLPIVGRAGDHTPDWALPRAQAVRVGDRPDAAWLRQTASLVDRVTVTVRVPQRSWPLERSRIDDDVVLLDFPGRGASPSEMRDRFLLRRELDEINTIVVLFDPDKPDASDPSRIWMDFEKRDYTSASGVGDTAARRADAVLAAIGRFDRHEESAPELVDGVGPLPPMAIVDHPRMTGLRALWREAERATARGDDDLTTAGSAPIGHDGPAGLGGYNGYGGHDVAIVSVATAWAMGGLGDNPPFHPPSQRAVADWKAELRARAHSWGRIAGRVPGGQGIAGPLTEYAEDGGLGRLRRLITRHAERRGLAQKASRMRPYLDELKTMVWKAQQDIDIASEAVAAAGSVDRKEFGKLIAEAKDALDDSAKRCVLDVFAPGFVLPNGRGGPDEIRRTVTAAVFGWRLWERLLDSVVDGVVQPGRRPVVTVTTDLCEPFVAAVGAARTCGAQVADAMVWAWLDNRRHELTGRIDELKRRLEPVRDQVAATHADLLRKLARAVQVGWIGDLEIPDGESDAPLAETLFPLRTGRALPWHPQRIDRDTQRSERHQIYVMRLRRDLAASAVRAGHAAMATRLRQHTEIVRDALVDLVEDWPSGREVDGFLDRAFGPAYHRRSTAGLLDSMKHGKPDVEL
jgi:hypothetical protein